MIMWLRLGAALLVTFAAIGCLEYFGLSSLFGGRSADEMQHDAESRARELFWVAIFAVVMVMAVVAALRRWADQLRHALFVSPQLKRRDLA
jgi:hypothetical protein